MMETLIKMVGAFIGAEPDRTVSSQALMAFNKEDSSIQAKREEALQRMKQMGRPSLLEGGSFSRNLVVLTQRQQSIFRQ